MTIWIGLMFLILLNEFPKKDYKVDIINRAHYKRELQEDSIYMIVYYGRKTRYDSGFANEKRTNIKYILNDKSNLGPDNPFIIEKGSKIEINFSSTIITLEGFFDRLMDDRAIKIISVDLSNFEPSEVSSTAICFLIVLI